MNQKFIRRVKRNDRIARWVITGGGMAIIFTVIFILLLIAEVALPLFSEPHARLQATIPAVSEQGVPLLAVGLDDYLETGYALDQRGRMHFFEIADGRRLDTLELGGENSTERTIAGIESFGRQEHAILWSDGSLEIHKVQFRTFFDVQQDNRRSILHDLVTLASFAAPEQRPLQSLARVGDEGRLTRVDLLTGNRLRIEQQESAENFLGEVVREDFEEILDSDWPGQLQVLTLSSGGQQLYAGTANGYLLRFDLSEAGEATLIETVRAFDDGRAVTALTLIFGDVSLAVGDSKGGLATWFPVRETPDDHRKTLRQIHPLIPHEEDIVKLSPSLRDKSLVSLSADGILHIDHMTSERHLVALSGPQPLVNYALSTRSDGLIAQLPDDRLLVWRLEIPHPEVSWKTLFGKVWYEGYDEPSYSWQSSAANDDFEPKLSLTPLIFGTLKGTFYAMIFAVPLALAGAIYTSQFVRPRVKALVKPTVEIMAAIPTVIIGFLAALWLAPLIERSLGAVFFSIVLIPGAMILAILLWQGARRFEPLKRIERGYEFLAIAPVVLLGLALATTLGPLAEDLWFGGDLKQWLFTEWGTRYDPRNCIIIAFAMGFAVIPIIFTIAEDALSNVPPSLRAASLALGASRWQTVWRVILPSASPGIFAGAMIGFGRAVGETMIVLMATGNTAIMDLSIFNGMRPLSANIAVEIPEAPHGGTLYRVLFLSAVILFAMTFVVNTVAELVRQRLRQKYGRF